MERIKIYFIFLLCLAMWCCNKEDKDQEGWAIPVMGYSTPESYPDKNLVWQDEFDGDHLDLSAWKHETGGNGWGNNELQYYQANNTTVRDGYLIITAKKEKEAGKNYTSSRIITQGQKEFQYGRIDIRALVPRGQGIWPALWMLGYNISDVHWPACGEIDIMEMIGGAGRENTVHGTAHWQGADNHVYKGGSHTLKDGKALADEFHVYSILWTSTFITWLIDDIAYFTLDISPSEMSELQNKHYIIFNVAVGGNWPGNPDDATTFPQHMVVDYIRVFQDR